ncbi:MAG: N-acetyltransferase [Pseudomonadota bacterium]
MAALNKPAMLIRPECPADAQRIRDLTTRAFNGMPYSDGSEPGIIDALRRTEALTLSLVAEVDGVLVGQITFSPVTIDGRHDHWFGLGPVSVDPRRQKAGIGSALINEGLKRMKETGAKGIVLVGDPLYYQRFGFEGAVGLSYAGIDPHYVQRIVMALPDRQGTVRYTDAFEDAAAG